MNDEIKDVVVVKVPKAKRNYRRLTAVVVAAGVIIGTAVAVIMTSSTKD